MGGAAGEPAHTLAVTEMPSHNHAATSTDGGHSHSGEVDSGDSANAGLVVESGGIHYTRSGGSTGTAFANITTTIGYAGGGSAHNIIQPTILCNYIIRII